MHRDSRQRVRHHAIDRDALLEQPCRCEGRMACVQKNRIPARRRRNHKLIQSRTIGDNQAAGAGFERGLLHLQLVADNHDIAGADRGARSRSGHGGDPDPVVEHRHGASSQQLGLKRALNQVGRQVDLLGQLEQIEVALGQGIALYQA